MVILYNFSGNCSRFFGLVFPSCLLLGFSSLRVPSPGLLRLLRPILPTDDDHGDAAIVAADQAAGVDDAVAAVAVTS